MIIVCFYYETVENTVADNTLLSELENILYLVKKLKNIFYQDQQIFPLLAALEDD